ncbi:MAG: FHA domain-containing protein [Polyangiaceae bacterium]
MFTPLDFYEKNAVFTVTVNGQDFPAKFDSKYKWADSQQVQGVGTAWLIVLDVGGAGGSGTMAARLNDAKEVARAFIDKMGPQDIADVFLIGDRALNDSKWKTAGQKADLTNFVNGAAAVTPSGRTRNLATAIRQAAVDGFKSLGNVGGVAPPMHQAMVVLSNGASGADPSSTGPGGLEIAKFASQGRYPPENTAAPKMPTPIISIFFPSGGIDEAANSARDFMSSLPNPDVGGYFNVVRGNGAAAAGPIVNAVRDRFGQMFLVRWRVSCVAPATTQSFKLNFQGTSDPIIGDNSFANVPLGVDPTQWPLDVNVKYTVDNAKRDPVYPGGSLTVYGNFCWGGNASGVQIYFLPPGTQAPQTVNLSNLEEARRAQQQLIARKLDGKAIKVTDSSAEFEAPNKSDWIWGKGDQAVARVIVYDTNSRRTSGLTAATILSVKASESAPFNWLWVALPAFGGIVVVLLVVLVFRTGGNKPRRGGGGGAVVPPAPPVPPVPAGPGPGANWAPPGAGYAPPPGGGYPPPGGGAPGGTSFAAAPGGGYGGTTAPVGGGAPPGASPDFLYGGKPPQYGLTTGQPAANPPPPDPYGAPVNASRATLSGTGGVYTILAGMESRLGRDGAQVQIVLSEPRVSGFHATLKIENGQFFVRDEGSNNGTWINGNRVNAGTWNPVPQGAQLKFGPAEFSVRLE